MKLINECLVNQFWNIVRSQLVERVEIVNPFISRISLLCKNDNLIQKLNVFSSVSKVLLSHGPKTFHKIHKILMPKFKWLSGAYMKHFYFSNRSLLILKIAQKELGHIKEEWDTSIICILLFKISIQKYFLLIIFMCAKFYNFPCSSVS